MLFSFYQIPFTFGGEIGAFDISGPGTFLAQMLPIGIFVQGEAVSSDSGNYSF